MRAVHAKIVEDAKKALARGLHSLQVVTSLKSQFQKLTLPSLLLCLLLLSLSFPVIFRLYQLFFLPQAIRDVVNDS